jgi:ATP-binding protein involved in chromosome partitioning
MNKEQVLDHLKSINYPGFSRDIVSFGMVKDVEINGDQVIVHLNISSSLTMPNETISLENPG